MSEASTSGTITAIVPCNDLDASERFYSRLGFTRPDSARPAPGEDDSYRILSNGQGGHLHLTEAVKGWVLPGRNPFGLYLYTADVDALAANFVDEIIEAEGPSDKPGACMNSRCRIPTACWCASAGRAHCGEVHCPEAAASPSCRACGGYPRDDAASLFQNVERVFPEAL